MFSFADEFGIKEPFPGDIYRIEGTETKVTCVAFDSSGVKTPERIQFVRRDKFARYTNVSASENVLFTEGFEYAGLLASELFLFGTFLNMPPCTCTCMPFTTALSYSLYI